MTEIATTEIIVPKVNANDDTYVLLEWLFADGEPVPADAAVAVLETSKASHDLVVPTGGVLHRMAEEMVECRHGEVIGRLFASPAERESFLAMPAAEPAAPEADDVTVTDAARELARQHGIPLTALRELGPVVRSGDVERLVAGTDSRVRHLSRQERAVAAVVTEAHATIPAAFTAITVYDRLKELRERGVAEPVEPAHVVLKAMAHAYERFPLFFGELRDGHEVRLPGRVDIGVTVDAGAGLYVPAVRDPAALRLGEIAAVLDRHHRSALAGSFREEELTGSCIGLSVNSYTDVVLVVPVIFPPHLCMVSLGGPRRELSARRDGGLVTRTSFTLGVAYDHRVLSGRDAVRFLKHLKASVEDLDQLQEWGAPR